MAKMHEPGRGDVPPQDDHPLRKHRPIISEPLITFAEKVLGDAIKSGAAERALVDEDPRDVPLETVLTLLDFGKLSHKQLMAQAQRRIELAPSDPTGYRLLAFAHGVRDEFSPAIKAMEKATSLAPDDVTLSYELGHWHRLNGYLHRDSTELTTAVQIFENLTRKDQSEPRYPFHLGLLRGDLRTFDLARDAFAEALNRDPKYAHAWQYYGRACMDTGRRQDARDAYLSATDAFIEKIASARGPVRQAQYIQTARECLTKARMAGGDEKIVRTKLDAIDRLVEDLNTE